MEAAATHTSHCARAPLTRPAPVTTRPTKKLFSRTLRGRFDPIEIGASGVEPSLEPLEGPG